MPPRLSDFGTGPQALKAYQAALAAYKVQQAQKKAAPQPAAQPAPQSTPQKSQVAQPAQQPLSTTPTQQTVQGVQPFAKPPVQQGATQQPGLDEQSLLKSGISQEQLYKAKSILSASQNLAASQSQRAEELKKFTQEDLKQGQQEVEGMYNNLKTQKQQLAAESEQVISETAEVQKDIASQEYQKNKFMNEQAQKQYEIDTQRAERKQEQANEEDETALRRAMAAQLGASFGSEGLVRITKSKQEGEEILADLRAKTAIGNAEFSFKAMEIESKYSTTLKEISNTRKSEILNVKKTLDDQLTAIDEKVLMSKEAKREAAREAVTNYYNQLNEIDTKSAQTTTQMVETLFKEKKDLEQEKEVREAIDLNVSSALGFFANKFGDPIGVREGEQPRPFTGQFNGALSQQFGYLVDEQGRAILASDGQKIKFKDFTKQEKQSALERLLSGNATGYDAAEVNGMTGNNAAIVAAAPEGSYGGQCGTFVRTRFTTEGGWEGKCAGLSGAAASACSMQVKKELVDSRGQRREDYAAKVGDILCFTGAGYGTTGHYAIINSISEDGKTYTLTESNMDLKGTIHNTRKVQADNPAIYGGFTPQLKSQFANANPKTVEGSAASEGDETAPTGVNPQTVNILKKIQAQPAAYLALDAGERTAIDNLAGGKDNMAKILSGGNVGSILQSMFGGGDNVGVDIDKYRNNPSGFLSLPKEQQDKLKGILSDDQIQQVLYQGKSINDIVSTEQKIKMDALNKKNEKNIQGKPLSDSAIQGITKFDSIESSVKQLDALAKTMQFDPKTGWVRENNPWDDQAQQFKAIKQAFSGPAARAIMQEVGALTDSDLARLDKLLPSMGDTKETAMFKIGQLKDLLVTGRKRMLENYKKAGRDVSDFMDEGTSSSTPSPSGTKNSKGFSLPSSNKKTLTLDNF